MADTSNSGNTVDWKAAALGAVAAVVLAPVAAAILAIVYRFPVPFGDYARGFDDAGSAALASVFYLILGGAPVLAILGATGGFISARTTSDARRIRLRTLLTALAAALLAATTLALLEFIVGPW